MRLHLFEFEDLPWFPNIIREGMVDYLRFVLGKINFYEPITSLLIRGLEKSGQNKILDLCSGGGGAILQVHKNLSDITDECIEITLSDKFPNVASFQHIREVSNQKIDFIDQSIDATNVPESMGGMRTMFTAFHHFNPDQAKKVLTSATDRGWTIAIFDGGDKNILSMLGILVFHPIIFLLGTPFFRPFRISRLLFTYIIPLIPICTIWDGLVSILRLYEPNDLRKLVKEIDSATYHWEIGKAKHRLGFRLLYLLGYQRA